MKLVVGLGNPGARYVGTRHNAGFRVVERFARDHGIALDEEAHGGRFGRGPVSGADAPVLDVGVLEPESFMNLSGDVVAGALQSLPVGDPAGDLLLVFDDVDLPFGRLRVRPSGGAGGHRGLESVIEALGHGDFPRLRFGVGRPPEGVETADWVLQPFSSEEEREMPDRVARGAEALETVLLLGPRIAMDRYNAV